MKINQLKLGSALSYAQMAISVIIGLIYTPVMLRLLGQSEYGLYNTVSSTISVLSVLNLGFNSSYIRYFAKYKARNDTESINRLNGLFLTIFSIIGTIALVCGIFLTFNLEMVFDEGLTDSEYHTARILMLLLTANLAISFPMSVFSNIISANEKFVFLKLLGMMKTICGPMVSIMLLFMGYHSIAMVASTVIISLITDIAYFVYVKYVLKMRFVFRRLEEGILKDLFVFTAFIAVNTIVYHINNNIGKLMLGRYAGTNAVAIYSIGFVLYHYYMMFSTSISSVFTPRVYKIVNSTQRDSDQQRVGLTDLFIRVGRVQYLILALVATGVLFFGKTFVRFWAGSGYDESYVVAVILIFASTFDLIENVGIEIQRALNRHKFRSAAYAVTTVINIFVTWRLCIAYGIIGAAVGTAIFYVISYGIIMNIFYHKRCNVDIIAFWKSIGRLSLGLILPIVFGIVLNRFMAIENNTMLILQIILYTCVYGVSMWFFGMNEYEKALVTKPLKLVLSNTRIK